MDGFSAGIKKDITAERTQNNEDQDRQEEVPGQTEDQGVVLMFIALHAKPVSSLTNEIIMEVMVVNEGLQEPFLYQGGLVDVVLQGLIGVRLVPLMDRLLQGDDAGVTIQFFLRDEDLPEHEDHGHCDRETGRKKEKAFFPGEFDGFSLGCHDRSLGRSGNEYSKRPCF
jgi:hypothetical protein